jgi:acyl-CoA thioesterase I
MKIVCLGDSLTFGYGVYPSQCWVDLLKQHTKCEIINSGINGDTTAGMLSRSYGDVIENKPTHVIIMGGTNDLLQDYSLGNVINNIEELIYEALQNSIKPIVAIQIPVIESMASIYWDDSIEYKKINKNLEVYRNWVTDYSKDDSLKYIDFYSKFTDELKCREKSELYVDGIHPTALGHKIMYECAEKLINSIYHSLGNN